MELKNYTTGKPQKWYTVAVFEHLPRENPRISKEGKDLAKFAQEGSAWRWAIDLVKNHEEGVYHNYALVVVR